MKFGSLAKQRLIHNICIFLIRLCRNFSSITKRTHTSLTITLVLEARRNYWTTLNIKHRSCIQLLLFLSLDITCLNMISGNHGWVRAFNCLLITICDPYTFIFVRNFSFIKRPKSYRYFYIFHHFC